MNDIIFNALKATIDGKIIDTNKIEILANIKKASLVL